MDPGGAVFTDAVLVEDGPSAYSSLAALPSGDTGILYERGAAGCRDSAGCGWNPGDSCPSCRIRFSPLPDDLF